VLVILTEKERNILESALYKCLASTDFYTIEPADETWEKLCEEREALKAENDVLKAKVGLLTKDVLKVYGEIQILAHKVDDEVQKRSITKESDQKRKEYGDDKANEDEEKSEEESEEESPTKKQRVEKN
jgi:hypothetical protein